MTDALLTRPVYHARAYESSVLLPRFKRDEDRTLFQPVGPT
jgi:hypothetical protein